LFSKKKTGGMLWGSDIRCLRETFSMIPSAMESTRLIEGETLHKGFSRAKHDHFTGKHDPHINWQRSPPPRDHHWPGVSLYYTAILREFLLRTPGSEFLQ